jgi:hypothetical protein
MTQIAQHDFTDNLFKLLTETFEGPPAEGGSAYLDKGAALFQTLDTITAEAASRPPGPGAPTIAAHCNHLGYYVRVLHNYIVGREQVVDWQSSWQVHQVEPEEWETLKAELRSGYSALKELLESLSVWDDEPVGDSMAIVVHTAYHLGAIRQALRAVRMSTEPSTATQ